MVKSKYQRRVKHIIEDIKEPKIIELVDYSKMKAPNKKTLRHNKIKLETKRSRKSYTSNKVVQKFREPIQVVQQKINIYNRELPVF